MTDNAPRVPIERIAFQAMINGARGGTIGIVSSGASNYNGIVANTAAMELRFVFRSAQHAYAVLDGPVGSGVLNELAPHG